MKNFICPKCQGKAEVYLIDGIFAFRCQKCLHLEVAETRKERKETEEKWSHKVEQESKKYHCPDCGAQAGVLYTGADRVKVECPMCKAWYAGTLKILDESTWARQPIEALETIDKSELIPPDAKESEFDAFIERLLMTAKLSPLERDVIADCILCMRDSWYKFDGQYCQDWEEFKNRMDKRKIPYVSTEEDV